MSDPAKTVTRLEYDDKVLRTFSVKKSDPVSCSASEPDSDCEDESLKSTEERFGNFIRFVSQTNKCSEVRVESSIFQQKVGRRP